MYAVSEQSLIALTVNTMTLDTLVQVRHAGLGWLTFTLGETQVCGLMPMLMKHQAARAVRKLTAPTTNSVVCGRCLGKPRVYLRPGKVRPRSLVHVTWFALITPVTASPRIGSIAGFHGASVKVSAFRMTAILPVGVTIARS